MNRLLLILAGAVGLFVAGLGLGWWLNRPAVVVELPAPASRQADGSLVLERTGTQIAPQKLPHALPAGAREERRVSVVVQPAKGVARQESGAYLHGSPLAPGDRPVQQSGGQAASNSSGLEAARLVASADHPVGSHDMVDSCDCPPVTVDLSLVRMPDKTRRVIASSPDGKILSGIDVPISAPVESAARPWAAGILITSERKLGAFLDRDVGPFRFGVESFQTPTGWGAAARAGIRF